MKMLHGWLPAGALALLSACAASPTGPDVAPVGPLLDGGGFTLGGGNAISGGSTAGGSACEGEERGGFTYGGGNYAGTEPCPVP